MTVGQLQVVETLGLALIVSRLVYLAHRNASDRARWDDPSEMIAWRFIEVVFAICVLVFAVSFVFNLLDATVWMSPEAQQPAPALTALDLVAAALLVVFIVIPIIRWFLRWRRHLPNRRRG